MSTLRTCPKCQCKSLESDSVRVWCVYVKGCGYSVLHNSAVDAGQMTHSDEPTDAEEREGMLAFADSVLGYQESDKRRIGSPVDGALNTDLARRGANYIRRLVAGVEAGERHLQSLKDDAGDMLCDLEDQVKRLEAERGCPSCAHCQLKRGGHLD